MTKIPYQGLLEQQQAMENDPEVLAFRKEWEESPEGLAFEQAKKAQPPQRELPRG